MATPNSRPHDPAVAPDGSLWYTGQRANKLGRLDPQTGQFKEDFHYYLNTEPKLDFVLELGNCPLLNLPEDECPTYPPERV